MADAPGSSTPPDGTPSGNEARGDSRDTEPVTLARLRAMPDEELGRRSDAQLAGHDRVAGPDDFVSELARRETQRLNATLVRLTLVVTVLAAVVAAWR